MTTTTIAATTVRLRALVAEIREAVDRGLPPGPTAQLVADLLTPHLGAPDLLLPEHHEGDPDRYRQHVLHAEPDGGFSLVALVWLPGQITPIHDHVAWGVTGVHQGAEYERRYRLVPDGPSARLVATEDVITRQGEASAFAPPGDIHRVHNGGTGTAVSVHVYGADITRLGTSVRRLYRLPADA
ncbi:cysteine dioxygenase family protein [Streptomyces sp. LP05-1]|uniref:Cysteine dioxygenase family protein n=1 Tax=Streptomyces pyxinae TaxID=2970734 RepID=A0ABT2CEP5_9ACTN|nr:cysteine dioxygenase family protein [Streptomyces sp. LP05-1]MCS0635841.1 cysteine dioxygenase family protein [Streptomyces sp. LP05-1]